MVQKDWPKNKEQQPTVVSCARVWRKKNAEYLIPQWMLNKQLNKENTWSVTFANREKKSSDNPDK